MRISDWSSDVCSSDLRTRIYAGFPSTIPPQFPPCNLTSPARGSKEAVSIPVIILALNGCSTFDFMPLLCLRSEEHTSELQSLMRISYAVFCLQKKNTYIVITQQ